MRLQLVTTALFGLELNTNNVSHVVYVRAFKILLTSIVS